MGSFELGRQYDAEVEFTSFVLLPHGTGKRRGAKALTTASTRAWEIEAQRVWRHLCILAYPQTLADSHVCGFRLVRVEERIEALQDEP